MELNHRRLVLHTNALPTELHYHIVLGKGFEPLLTDPKSAVLPLDDPKIKKPLQNEEAFKNHLKFQKKWLHQFLSPLMLNGYKNN